MASTSKLPEKPKLLPEFPCTQESGGCRYYCPLSETLNMRSPGRNRSGSGSSSRRSHARKMRLVARDVVCVFALAGVGRKGVHGNC